MANRHPIGGGIGGSSRPALGRGTALMLGACIALPLILAGCDSNHRPRHFDDYTPSPVYHYVTFVLNVSDLDGYALGEATVWVDGVAQREKTAWDFVALDDGFPETWRGFLANWIVGEFTVVTYGWDDLVEVEVMVTKAGYRSQATTFEITGDLPVDVYARETFAMEQYVGPLSAEDDKPVHKAKPGEVIGWSKETKSDSALLPTLHKLAAAGNWVALDRREQPLG